LESLKTFVEKNIRQEIEFISFCEDYKL